MCIRLFSTALQSREEVIEGTWLNKYKTREIEKGREHTIRYDIMLAWKPVPRRENHFPYYRRRHIHFYILATPWIIHALDSGSRHLQGKGCYLQFMLSSFCPCPSLELPITLIFISVWCISLSICLLIILSHHINDNFNFGHEVDVRCQQISACWFIMSLVE